VGRGALLWAPDPAERIGALGALVTVGSAPDPASVARIVREPETGAACPVGVLPVALPLLRQTPPSDDPLRFGPVAGEGWAERLPLLAPDSFPAGTVAARIAGGHRIVGGSGSGLLQVEGDLTLAGDATFRGILILAGDLVLEGSGRVVGAGVCMDADASQPLRASFKEASLHFVLAYEKDDFQYTVDMLAQGRIDPKPVVTDRVGLSEVPASFDALVRPGERAKVLVRPGSSDPG